MPTIIVNISSPTNRWTPNEHTIMINNNTNFLYISDFLRPPHSEQSSIKSRHPWPKFCKIFNTFSESFYVPPLQHVYLGPYLYSRSDNLRQNYWNKNTHFALSLNIGMASFIPHPHFNVALQARFKLFWANIVWGSGGMFHLILTQIVYRPHVLYRDL